MPANLKCPACNGAAWECDCSICLQCGQPSELCNCAPGDFEPLDFDDNSDDLTDKEDRSWE